MIKVAVLMSTYNGEKYLMDQINSILNQKEVTVSLFVRDDGSQDSTMCILNSLKSSNVYLLEDSRNLGYKNSFLSLLKYATDFGEFDYYAFADQDDVWKPLKLSHAVQRLAKNDKYAVYYSALQFVDSDLDPLYRKEYSLVENSLESSFVRFSISGATMVFSEALALKFASASIPFTIGEGHDTLIFRLNLALGGSVEYSDESYIMFRRHGNNESSGGASLITKFRKDFDKKNKSAGSETATWILKNFSTDVPNIERQSLKLIASSKTNLRARFLLLKDKKFRRENRVMNLIFRLKLVLGYI